VRTVSGAVPPPGGHDVTAGDDLLAAQVAYYRRRAGEYDMTAYEDLGAARARITRIVAALRPAGTVLEIACGTGMWTSALAGAVTAVIAIDAAPEMIGIARGRVTATNVRFEVADVFSWTAAARFDTVFFAFWLSHVPASRFEQLWCQLHGLVTEQGRVLFVDEHPDVHDKEAYAAGSDEIIQRRLTDGSEHRWSKSSSTPASCEPSCTSMAGRATSAGTAMTGSSARRAPQTRSRRIPGMSTIQGQRGRSTVPRTAAPGHKVRLPYQ
jgi:2-polyprenyl-3-methyl-5-hydroxy-6-metoxy-1,4-benzoquinol methylase